MLLKSLPLDLMPVCIVTFGHHFLARFEVGTITNVLVQAAHYAMTWKYEQLHRSRLAAIAGQLQADKRKQTS